MSLAAASTKSIFVAHIPFENMSLGGELDIFCRSFSMDLTTELSRFRHFQIITYQCEADFREAKINADKQGKQDLFANYLIKGSFRSDKKQFRINAQLINMSNLEVTWAHVFEGGRDKIFEIQDDLLSQIVSTLQARLNADLLIKVRKKKPVDLKAYEYWLHGLRELKRGTPESDEKARGYFNEAIAADDSFSLAYSGMSLTYFNERSCQLWDQWDSNQKEASHWAQRAIELDDQNYIAALVLGRVFLYEGAYETAEHYIRKSLALNNNDPEILIQIASCLNFLGFAHEALSIYERVLRIDNSNKESYYTIGIFILIELGEFHTALDLIQKIPPSFKRWIDEPAFFAAAYYETGNHDEMERCWAEFLNSFRNEISKDETSSSRTAVEWMIRVNPFKNESRLSAFWQYIADGASIPINTKKTTIPANRPGINAFQKKADFWSMSFEGNTVQLVEVKGFLDIKQLLSEPEQVFHCAELMGLPITNEKEEFVIDEQSKRAYQVKVAELQEELSIAENDNDLIRSETLRAEYDQIIDHLSKSLGLNGKTRTTGGSIEKARSAVTWRIRKAISKIEQAHPELGRHLSNAIKTGTFCGYKPEKPLEWILE